MPLPPDGRPLSRPQVRRRGFTLIELMVVVLIIGILVALTVTMIPRVFRAVHGAQTQAQMSAIAAGIQAYYGDFRAYPGPIPNNQLGAVYYSSYTTSPQNLGVYLPDPSAVGTYKAIEVATGPLGSETYTPMPTSPGMAGTQALQVTGAENLVLGLLGGLEVKYTTAAGVTTLNHFAYSDATIYPDGLSPAPLGPIVLSATGQKRMGAYIQVRKGDLSNSRDASRNPVSFADEASRNAIDSPIPEFLDKYSNQMPILYLRANVGASGVVTYGGVDELKSAKTYQYDLAQVVGYTGSLIGTAPGSSTAAHHGMQDIMPSASASKPMADTVTGNWSAMGPNEAAPPQVYPANMSTLAGANAFAYLHDPATPAKQPDGTDTTNGNALARQRDSFILISAGPDGIYGTADDIIYPGGSVVGQ
jgi:prepilin-type N-terminal cleavage/methylation domain-containing protein